MIVKLKTTRREFTTDVDHKLDLQPLRHSGDVYAHAMPQWSFGFTARAVQHRNDNSSTTHCLAMEKNAVKKKTYFIYPQETESRAAIKKTRQ